MTTINLKRYYPYMTENVMLEVSDEIAATLSMGGRLCDTRKTRRTRSGGSWMKKLPPLFRRFLHCAWTAWGRRKLQNGSKKIKFFRLLLRSVYKELHADHETGAADNK